MDALGTACRHGVATYTIFAITTPAVVALEIADVLILLSAPGANRACVGWRGRADRAVVAAAGDVVVGFAAGVLHRAFCMVPGITGHLADVVLANRLSVIERLWTLCTVGSAAVGGVVGHAAVAYLVIVGLAIKRALSVAAGGVAVVRLRTGFA